MGEELTGTYKAAALHGLALNRMYPLDERYRLALQALDIYEAEADKTQRIREGFEMDLEKLREQIEEIVLSGRKIRFDERRTPGEISEEIIDLFATAGADEYERGFAAGQEYEKMLER